MEALAASNQPISLGGTTSKGTFKWGDPPAPVKPPVVEQVAPEPVSEPEGFTTEDWRTPVHAQEVGRWLEFPKEDDPSKTRTVPWTMGIRVHMKDGSTWYLRHATKNTEATWTRRHPGIGKESSSRMSYPSELSDAGEQKDEPIPHRVLKRDCLQGKWPGRKMLDALNWGIDNAEPWRAQ